MTNRPAQRIVRYFVTYSGIKLPFNLTSELQEHQVENRNTYFKGYFDEAGRIAGFDKLASGGIELQHRYSYHANGRLSTAEITDIDGRTTMLLFDDSAAE